MATCKDCICYSGCSGILNDFGMRLNPAREVCDRFEDRSRFVELSHAEWVEDEDMYGDPIYHCSNCNEHFVLEEGTPTDNCYFYCPNCGAKMDEQALREREENA